MGFKCKEQKREWAKEYNKKYWLKHKEKLSQYKKELMESKKDGYHRVYLLENENYVGVTDSMVARLSQHKNQMKRDVSEYRVLYKTKDREEAHELEELLHDIGYKGRHNKNSYK